MYSSLQRLQTVFGFFTTVLTALSIAIALTSFLHFPSTGRTYLPLPSTHLRPPPQPSAHATLHRAVVKRSRAPRSYDPTVRDYAHLSLDRVSADLRGLWHWNTKQVFVYLVASYDGGAREMVVWDKIVKTYEEAELKIGGKLRNKYGLADIEGVWGTKDLTLTLHYNVQPQVGLLEWGRLAMGGGKERKGSLVVTLPERATT
ncbi:Signal peptidase complex subunit [Savitreella phatthalungensis]